MFNIEFFRFQQNYTDFFKEIRLISLQAMGLNTCEIYLHCKKNILNLPTTTYCPVKLGLGMGRGKNFKTNLIPTSTHFDDVMVPVARPYMPFSAV